MSATRVTRKTAHQTPGPRMLHAQRGLDPPLPVTWVQQKADRVSEFPQGPQLRDVTDARDEHDV